MSRAAIAVAASAAMLIGVLGLGVGVAAGAAPAAPVQMSYACALKVGGLMRYVTSPSKCSTKVETAVTIKPGPVKTCVSRTGLVNRTTSTCPRGTTLLTLPPATNNAYFCAVKVLGVLRSVSSPTRCTKLEFAVVVTPNNLPPVANDDLIGVDGIVVLDVLGNDTDPDGNALTITSINAPGACGLPEITPDGLGIKYDGDAALYSFCTSDEGDTETFSYTVADGHGGTDTATVTVAVWDPGRDFAAACIPLVVAPSTTVARGQAVTLYGTAVWHDATIFIVLNNSVVIGTATTGPDPGGPHDAGYNLPWSTTVTIPANTSVGSATIQAFQFISPTQPNGCPAQVAPLTIT